MSDKHPEIVIIRRGGHSEHDEHHGGVWKIAFADFMTAMMAFFLVLWLISANDKTRASVARYFNPVRLIDTTTQPRGLQDSKKDSSSITVSSGTKEKNNDANAKADNANAGTPVVAAPETARGRDKRLNAELRDNPYVALAEIVGTKGPGDSGMRDAASPTPAIGQGGTAFRDPFAPPPSSSSAMDDTKDDDELAPPPAPASTTRGAAPAAQDEVEKTSTARSGTDGATQKQSDQMEGLKAALKGLNVDRAGPAIDVRKTSEGTLLSLTDTDKFTMFANGSAVPSRHVILMMEKVAQLLKKQPGTIVVRGFTDNKKFRSGAYDNWHLSLDRAQVAHYMLTRGGLGDVRFSHVEGYADHASVSGLDPASPSNRRIEILLKDPMP